MEFSQNLTDEVVNLWNIGEMDLVYQLPLLMQVGNAFAENCQLGLENVEIEQFQNMQQYVLEPIPSFYLAPVSNSNISSQFVQNQNEDIRIRFTNQEELEAGQSFQKKDSPDLVDVRKLSYARNSEQNVLEKVVEDDDEEVIFVKEYKPTQVKIGHQIVRTQPISAIPTNQHAISTRGASYLKQESVRRNPCRKARNLTSCQKLAKEHFLEGDFAFLDESDDDDLVQQKQNSAPSTSTGSTSSNENYKVWPINVHERPEYNPKTSELEPFDYSIREIQKSYVKRRPQLETTFKSKVKKRYFIRKRKTKQEKAIEKVPISEIGETIRKTHEMVKDFCSLLGEDAKKFNFLEKNQSVLVSLLDDFKEERDNKK